jgi:hypothetical protein
MLERRVARGIGQGSALGERARAVARRDDHVGTDRVASTVSVGGARRVTRQHAGAALASLVATLVVAVGLVIAFTSRPVGGPLSTSPSDGSGLGGSAGATQTELRPPATAWDAITWSLVGSREIVFDGDSSQFIVDAARWGGGVVAIGYDIDATKITGRVWRSSDGTDWRELTSGGPPLDRISLDRIFALGDRLVITGRDRSTELGGATDDPGTPIAFESRDGDTWRPVTDAGSPWLRPQIVAAVAGGGMVLVLDGIERGFLWRSKDGQTWTSASLAEVFPQALIGSLAWSGDRWLVGGVVGERPEGFWSPWGAGAVWTSPDGANWSPATIDAPELSIGRFAVGREGIVAIGGRTGGGGITLTDPLWQSDEGTTWTPLAFDNQQLALVSDGERIVALDRLDDQRLRIRESFDGSTWREVEVLGLGRFDPAHPETIDGWLFPGNLQPTVLIPGGIWALGQEHLSSIEGESEIEAELRWFGTVGRLPGAATFPPRPLPGSNDVPCEPVGQECG